MELEKRGRVARLTRRAHNPEIPGSNPGPATSYLYEIWLRSLHLENLIRAIEGEDLISSFLLFSLSSFDV